MKGYYFFLLHNFDRDMQKKEIFCEARADIPRIFKIECLKIICLELVPGNFISHLVTPLILGHLI